MAVLLGFVAVLYSFVAVLLCFVAILLWVLLQYYWVLLQYYWVLSLLLLVQIVIIVFVFIFYFMEDVAQTLKLYPEDLLRDAIIKYREDVDMRNFIDDMQEFVSIC